MTLVLPRMFKDSGLDVQIIDLLTTLKDSERLHDPLIWRESIPALASLGYQNINGSNIRSLSIGNLMDAYRFFGSISLDLRDVPGLGHGRIFQLPKQSSQFAAQLSNIASAKSFAAICITEEQGGSDLHAIKTTAERKAGGYELNGRKKFVGRLRQADIYIVFAKTTDTSHGLSVFYIDSSHPSLAVSDDNAMGLRGVSWGQLDLENVWIPTKNRIGGEGQGFSLFSSHFSFWRCAMAAAAIGAAESALEKAKLRLHHRSAFSAPIGRFTHLQQEYAKHASRLYMAWLLVQSTARRIELKQYSYIDAAMAKAESVEAAIASTQWSMLAHGAYGYSAEANLEKTMRDLLGLRIADGTTDVLRGQVARGLLGEDLYALSIGRHVNSNSFRRERKLW